MIALEQSVPAHGMHKCACHGHEWKFAGVCSYSIADLYTSLMQQGAVVVETQWKWELMLAAKLECKTRNQVVHLAFVEQVGDLHFTHRSAHGGQACKYAFEGSNELLHELEASFPDAFAEPKYPITEHHMPLTIPLIDPGQPPPQCKLYPSSSLELEELRKQV